MVTFRQLQYLVAVADTLHFRRAAARCHVSQPTLSGQIQDLEARLGVRLIERGRSRVLLTAMGQQIVARARVILRDMGELIELARSGEHRFEGTLRMGVLPTLGPYLLPQVFPQLHARFPRLQLYVREGRNDDLTAGLASGAFDVLLTTPPVDVGGITVTPLFDEPLLVALPSDHRLTVRTVLPSQCLGGETVLALESGHRLREQVRDLAQHLGAKLATDYEGTSLDALRLMVQMGMGLAILPALYIRSEVAKDPGVVVRPLDGVAPVRPIALVWREQSARTAELQTIATVIRDWAAATLGPGTHWP